MVDVTADVKTRLESIPGYEPGKPAHRMDDVTFMDELEPMWGRRWGAQSGIGELRTVLYQRPQPARRDEDLGDPNFFVNFGSPGDLPDFEKQLIQYDVIRAALESEGVEVIDADSPPGKRRGVYSSEVKSNLEPVIIRGGAIIHRTAIAGKRGQERWIAEILTSLGCPILFTVHGSGIHECRGNMVFLDPKHCVQATSVRSNLEGLRQVAPVLMEAGVEEIHEVHLTSYLNSMKRTGGAMAFHLANVLNLADEKLAVVHSGALPYDTLRYLQDKGIKLIDTPEEEAINQAANIMTIRPGVVIIASGNPITTAALREEGVRVIEVEMARARFGSGPSCQIGPLVRDDGPYLDD